MNTAIRFLAITPVALLTFAAWAAPSVQQCFYECKRDITGLRFAEVTTLMIANENQPLTLGDHVERHSTRMVILDGQENVIAVTGTKLSPRDLDEINICATLQQTAGIVVPSAGLIQVATLDHTGTAGVPKDGDGVAIWMKNVVGRFTPNQPEPFLGKVSGVGKTACKKVDPSIVTATRLLADPEVLAAPQLPPVLIEQTKD